MVLSALLLKASRRALAAAFYGVFSNREIYLK
jgi:hypothetical protein